MKIFFYRINFICALMVTTFSYSIVNAQSKFLKDSVGNKENQNLSQNSNTSEIKEIEKWINKIQANFPRDKCTGSGQYKEAVIDLLASVAALEKKSLNKNKYTSRDIVKCEYDASVFLDLIASNKVTCVDMVDARFAVLQLRKALKDYQQIQINESEIKENITPKPNSNNYDWVIVIVMMLATTGLGFLGGQWVQQRKSKKIHPR